MDALRQQLSRQEQINKEYLRKMSNIEDQSKAFKNLADRAERSAREQKAEFERRARQQKEESDRRMNDLKVKRHFEIIHSIF